jgi:hypothetical protein
MATDIARSNSLTDLAHRINQAHHLAMRHANEAVGQAIACGEMLLEAKAKVPHGQWLPWLRQNVTFGERSAQGYMRLATHAPIAVQTNIRDALKRLAAPRRHQLESLLAECGLWIAHSDTLRAGRPERVEDWTHQDVKNCADIIRGYDSIFHRYGICHPEDCTVCDTEHDERHRNGDCEGNCPICKWERDEANPQRVADLASG